MPGVQSLCKVKLQLLTLLPAQVIGEDPNLCQSGKMVSTTSADLRPPATVWCRWGKAYGSKVSANVGSLNQSEGLKYSFIFLETVLRSLSPSRAAVY